MSQATEVSSLLRVHRDTKDRQETREGHWAIFLTGLLFTALIVIAAAIAIDLLPVLKVTAPTEPPVIHHQQNHTTGNERQWWQDR